MLTRDQILSAPAPKPEVVAVPELGGEVGVRVMSGAERDAWEITAFTDGKVNRENFRARLLVKTICDESGAPLFTDADIPALAAKPSPALITLADVALRINALTKTEVDELTKN